MMTSGVSISTSLFVVYKKKLALNRDFVKINPKKIT